MDLQPTAPYAFESSFPSPTHFQMNTDPLITLEKLHDFCHVESTSSASSAFPKFSYANFSSPSTKAGTGIDLTSKLFSASTDAATWVPSASHERICSTNGPHFFPNKIDYRNHDGLRGIQCSPPALHSPPTSASATLQGILQRCGLGNTPSIDQKNNKKYVSGRLVLSSAITQKIRNLDEILRNLDHYPMSKRFTIAQRGIPEPLWKKRQQWGQPPTRQDTSGEQPMSNADHTSEILGGSIIPDGIITHVKKSISRMEFRAQMEKLSGIIDDQWPDNRKFAKVERVETKALAETLDIVEECSTRNVSEGPPPRLIHKEGADASAASTNFVEEMLRNIAGLEHRLGKREKSKQTKRKGCLARGRLWVKRPAGKKMAAMMQKQFRRHAASINYRLDKTDLAIKSLRRQRQDALSPFCIEGNDHQHKERKVSGFSGSSSNIQTVSLNYSRDTSSTASGKNLAESGRGTDNERFMEVHQALSRNIQNIQDQLCTLHRDSQQMCVSKGTFLLCIFILGLRFNMAVGHCGDCYCSTAQGGGL